MPNKRHKKKEGWEDLSFLLQVGLESNFGMLKKKKLWVSSGIWVSGTLLDFSSASVGSRVFAALDF